VNKFILPITTCSFLLTVLIAQYTKANSQVGLDTILSNNTKLEKLSGGFEFIEGPVWNRSGFLLFSDIGANTIYKWTPNGQISIFRHPAGYSNGNTLDLEGRLITAEHDRRLVRTENDGKLTVLAERYENKRLNSPNDVVTKSDGSIYFTDPPYGIGKDKEELGFYGVYQLSADRTLRLLTQEMVRPNGLAFSPDEKKLYVSDSQKQHILVFHVKPDGTLDKAQVFAQLPGSTDKGVPDGMKVDVQGNVYCSGSGGIWVFSPNAQLLSKIIVPDVVTNLAWGDKDYKTLYITASNSLYKIRLNIAGIQPSKSSLLE
jgi:gluconolactonase